MKKVIYSVFTILMLSAWGCSDDFFDINENPNSPTSESVNPQYILPRVLHATASRMATSYDFSAHWMGYWARSGTYGPSQEQESYNITTGFQADEWSGWYDLLTDVDIMEKKAAASGENFYVASAKLLKSIGFMYLVDQYNNVPYSKAFDVTGNILPSYDKGQDIYTDLLAQLDEAAKLMANAEITTAMNEVDILFGKGRTADIATQRLMWRKLINSQRLKLLLRQSEVFGGTAPTAEIAKITTDGSGFLGTTQSASVQPGYTAGSANQQNPYFETYKQGALGTKDDYNRANNYVLNKFRSNNDPRYQYFFSAAATPLGGNTYYGYNFGEIIPNSAPNAANSSDVAGPGLAKSATQPQWLFTSVESMFLQAEATQRGWLSGDAKAAYENAVRESFIWLGVTNATATANTYLSEGFASYDAAANKINLIVMQKYLALVGVNNFEAWVDYRRVGIPTDLPLSLSPNRGNNRIPQRLLYPQAEYTYNSANVAAEGNINPQNDKVFWDK
ncbi:SusD/RagB family nutrient-binding outer membrane lipoprotein [Rufibacter immobilis]|uniref:SusD/RagB family nutrient-binding outer membrane lipoprotein n=1 Tax=Rufibacter immobilis TaxID=1348778 RepID=A0A3M9N578_9BACT|nr:SusD/RagB family nutrient-binding outer membrane lipoprotein [Rufibacter immobilis]RNI32896.1 SusD/RagB family nutrient-binding outer membrane lipoprotein [Rufibacter immobilis]